MAVGLPDHFMLFGEEWCRLVQVAIEAYEIRHTRIDWSAKFWDRQMGRNTDVENVLSNSIYIPRLWISSTAALHSASLPKW